MAQEVKLMGATYSDVPTVMLPDSNDQLHAFTDTSDADAIAADILAGKTAYVNGAKIVGTGSGGGIDGDNLAYGTVGAIVGTAIVGTAIAS